MSERNWTGKSKGNKTGHQIFIWLLKNFGLKPAYGLLIFVAFYYFVTSINSNKYIYQFHRKLGFNKAKSFFCIYNNYFSLGQTIIDKIVAMAGFNNRFTFNFDGEEYLHQMILNGKGGIMLSAHSGNWEIAGHYLDRLNTPIHILLLDAEYENLKNYLNQVTGKRKANIIVIKDDMSHVFEIMEALNNNELICIHADRLLKKDQKSIDISFLNEKARFPYGIFKMIISYNVPVTFVFAHKETSSHYHFTATQSKIYNETNKEAKIMQLATDYASELEKKVKQYPLQWYNYFNFWEKA